MEEINEQKELERLKAKKENALAMTKPNVAGAITEQYNKNTEALSKNEDFQNLTKEITEREAKAKLTADMLTIMTEEHKNELSAYWLACEKKKLEYKQKLEKKVIEEEVKSEVYNRKLQALISRYGYMYEKDENGNPKNFIPTKGYNRQKELVNWWNGQSDNFKKVVKGALKFLVWSAVITIVCVVGYRGIKWLLRNTQNIPNLNV